MSTIPPEVCSILQHYAFSADSSTPFQLDSPIVVSNDNKKQAVERAPSGTQNAPFTNEEEPVRTIEIETNVQTAKGDKGEDVFQIS